MLSLVQMRAISLNEAKIVHGRELIPYIPPKLMEQLADGLVKSGTCESKEEAMAMLNSDDEATSLSSNDAYNSIIQREIENYDKRADQLILASESITQAYNDYLSAKFDKARERMEKYSEYMSKAASAGEAPAQHKTEDGSLVNSIDTVAQMFDQYDKMCSDSPDYKPDEFKRTLIEGTFYTSDDPELIRRHVQLRMNYNNNIIKMMQKMLQTNYQILGFSKDEALLLSQKMSSAASSNEDTTDEARASIKTLKAAVLKNKDKFDKGNGVIDMRSIGAGVIFGTKEETGLDDFVSIDRMLQTSLRWECIIFGHGDTVHKDDMKKLESYYKKRDEFEARQEKLREEHEKLLSGAEEKAEKFEKVIEKNPQYEHLIKPWKRIQKSMSGYSAEISRLIARSESIRKSISKLYDQLNKMYDVTNGMSYDEVKKKADKIKGLIDKMDKRQEKTRTLIEQYSNRYNELVDMMEKSIDKGPDGDKMMKLLGDVIPDSTKKVMKELSEQDEALENELNKIREEVMERGPATGDSKKDYRWMIQPVRTLNAGPFIDMNDVVRQAIKEGFKSIYIISCNPGHHELDPDIKKTKGVRISHAMNTLLAESIMAPYMDDSFDMGDPIDESEYRLYQTEQHMMQICNECGIDYYDDELLDESITALNEAGIGAKAWSTIVSLVKKALSAVIALFKKLIGFFRSIIERIKAFFNKIFGKDAKIERQLRKSFNTKFIIVENAGMKAVTVNNWDDLQKGALDSCNKIAAKIQKMEREQTELLKKTQQFAEQQERKAPKNESVTLQTLRMLARQ